MAVAFDTLTYARRLREAGVPQDQAEAHAEALAAAVTETLATKDDLRALVTKQDLRDLEAATKQDLHDLKVATNRDLHDLKVATKRELHDLEAATTQAIHQLAATTKQGLHELELRLTVRLGGMVGVSVAAVAALVKLL